MVLACATLLILGTLPPGATAVTSDILRRYPYLTDLVTTNATVNWATTTSVASGAVHFGKLGAESCSAHNTTASRRTITVDTTTEYQWKAKLSGLATNTVYCYRIYAGSTDLLGSDPTPSFRRQMPAGSTSTFSFAVFGDWGKVNGGGHNTDQARLMSQIADSGARFAVTTGDTAYENGSQRNYGDLVQTGGDTSAIFGPSFWTVAGASIPLFNAQGNHGMSSVPLINWPQDRAVANSGGRYRMETYCCLNGTASKSYPSDWYAFDAGPARFYVLEAAWSNSNLGDATLYKNDADNHWSTSSAQYQWLENDLATHPTAMKFAFFHFPLYTDNSTEKSDTWLNGSSHLEGLLGSNGVDIVFNGHAHIYERNRASATGMPVSYVTGGGGGRLEPVNGCSSIDQYAIGWSYSSDTGRACGSATRPTSIDRVFHFLLVTVSGSQVTVAPTDELGRTFDVRTYTFS